MTIAQSTVFILVIIFALITFLAFIGARSNEKQVIFGIACILAVVLLYLIAYRI